MKKWLNKRGSESEISVWWIIAVIIMVLALVLIFDVKEAGASVINYVKNLRFGR